uniref:MD-2-related lipid-recognition domain-containing protein n=1 Tax=Alexandrium catenella TaxID=2925 RepID=A0A7S1WG37_ALECA|mmetsp:Transcript_58746/g.157392  ORF Transcript_58746/g.157392 Transcript_58746/m.157392 type:complete len:248 (+) Transcript_58746:53-796(+)
MIARALCCALLCNRLAAALSAARSLHQPREVLDAADAIWGEAVPEGIPHSVIDDFVLFDKVSEAVKVLAEEAAGPAVSLAEKPLGERPQVMVYWKARSLENGTAGVMKMDSSGCKRTADGGTGCTVDIGEDGGRSQKIHIRLALGRSLREGDGLITNIQLQMAEGDKQHMKFTCPACSFACNIPIAGEQMTIQMPPCPILAGVYDITLPLSAIPMLSTVTNITANTYGVHADGKPAFNLVSVLKLGQ